MSKIGRKTIRIPTNIKIFVQDGFIFLFKNSKFLKIKIPILFYVEFKKNQLIVSISDVYLKNKNINMFWGTFRSYLSDAIIGLSQNFLITLKIIGVGYRVFVEDNHLYLKIGFSHLIVLKIPSEIQVRTPKPNIISLRSFDKKLLAQFAARIRSYKIPEPYKGKGIAYKQEFIRRKEGKKK